MERLIWLNRALWVLVLAVGGYWVWSLFVSSRYQALCGASYWEMSASQVEACKDVKTELDSRR